MTGPSRERQRILDIPGVVSASCAVLLALYALYAFASIETRTWAIAQFAFVPARMAIALDVARPALRAAVRDVPQETFALLIGAGGGRWWTLVTHTVMHGSLSHVGSNCIWLVVFGSPVARRFGPARFLGLALATMTAGTLSIFLWDPASFIPVIGASAVVSGTAGAAARFAFPPAAPSEERGGDARRPALTLAETLKNRDGLFFIALFLAMQVAIGLVSKVSGEAIGWQAHIGGFLAGLLLFPLFDPRQAPVVVNPPEHRDTDGDTAAGRDEPVS